MEIPIIKLELYRQNPGQFTQELDRARQTEKVAQISGLEQQLVDDLYGYMQQHAQEIHMPDENSLGKNFYLQIFAFFPADDQEAYLLRNRPRLNQLVEGINKNLAEIANAVANACVSLYGSFKRPRGLTLLRYYQRHGLTFPKEKRKKVMVKRHKDIKASFVITPTASANGLQRCVNRRSVPLEPEKGHVLMWAGEDLESISDVKPLYHQVVYPESDRYALLYL